MKIKRKILTLALAGALAIGGTLPTFAVKIEEPTQTELSFSDLEQGEWYTEAMTDLVEKGILKGDNKGLVNPNKDLTRAEYAQILHNVLKFEGIIDLVNITDVKESDWFYEAVRGATAHGVLRGDGGMELRPDDPLTRQEMFVMTVRAFKLSDWENPVNKDYTKAYKDAKDVGSWAKESINILLDQEIIKGNNENKLLPKKNITRAEASMVISAMEEVKKIDSNTSIEKEPEQPIDEPEETEKPVDEPTTKPEEKPANKPGKVWVEEVGHWEDVYKKKLVSNRVVVHHPDEYEIIETYEYHFHEFNNPGYAKVCYTKEEALEYQRWLPTKNDKGEPVYGNFQVITIRNRGKLIKPAWDEVIKEAEYENVKVGTKWVVDTPGYWKDVE